MRWFTAIIAVLLSGGLHAASSTPPASLEAYATLREMERRGISASPDERSIAYKVINPDLRTNARTQGVYVRSLSGGVERRIDRADASGGTNAGPSASQLTLTWTPDSRALLYVIREDERAEIGALDIATGARKPLLEGSRFEKGYDLGAEGGATLLQFSPDGQWLAMTVPTVVPNLNPDFDVTHAVRIRDEDFRIYPHSERNGVLFALHLLSAPACAAVGSGTGRAAVRLGSG